MRKAIRKESESIMNSLRAKKPKTENKNSLETRFGDTQFHNKELENDNNTLENTKNEQDFQNFDSFIQSSDSSEDEHFLEYTDFENVDFVETDFCKLLANWAVTANITNNALNALLRILRSRIPDLPLDARTLKKTPRENNCIKINGGEYIHYGVKDALTDFCETTTLENSEINLNIHIDGINFFKSSVTQSWPILINVHPFSKVLVSGVFVGQKKAGDVNEYLKEFVAEMKLLLQNGFNYNLKHFKVNIRSFICDAPARAYVLGIKYHNGFFSCTKCQQKGERFQNRIIYKVSDNLMRTDEHFRTRSNLNHHNIVQPLAIENLPINIVNQFALDYMHIVCLGVVKTLLKGWKSRGKDYSLSKTAMNLLDTNLLSLKPGVCREFCRKPRSISDIDRWKAVEYRQFLLYTGPVVLKNILTSARYTHFLKFTPVK